MERRWLLVAVLVVAVVAIAAIALSLGGERADQSPPINTTTTTTTAKVTTTTIPTTTDITAPTPEPTTTKTTETTETITSTTTRTRTVTEPSFTHTLPSDIPAEVHDGEMQLSVLTENTGSAGDYTVNLTVDRHDGDHYDAEYTIDGSVGANGKQTKNLTVDFGATGVYTVYLNGSAQGSVDVVSLHSHSWFERIVGTQDETDISPTAEASARGNSTVG